jgi:hypothetical protein
MNLRHRSPQLASLHDGTNRAPITEIPDRGAFLRVKPTKNNQAKGVRWAKDYVLGDRVKVPAAAG